MTVLTDFLAKSQNSIGLVIRVIQVFLLLLIGYILAKAIILFFNPEVNWTPLASPEQTVANISASKRQSFDFSTDPFGVSEKSGETVSEEGFTYDPNLDVPETSLNIRVKGWIAGEFGSASLQTPDNKEASYRIGESVMDNVTLEAVTSDYIVLNVRGELQRLTFERDDQDMLLGSTPENTIVETSSTPSPKVLGRNNQVNFDVKTSKLLEQVRLNPNFDQGRLTGYIIQPKGEQNALKQFGLQAGDELTAINGESLTQGRLDLQELALTLNSANSVRLSIVRNGRSQTVKIGQ